MESLRRQSRRVAAAVLVAFAGLTFGPAAQAGMVGTSQALGGAALDRAELLSTLERADIQARLVAQGVDPADVRARVAALTDEEARALAARFDALPAGGDIVGAVVFVFLVLLITDLAGVTDVFPFVNKAR